MKNKEITPLENSLENDFSGSESKMRLDNLDLSPLDKEVYYIVIEKHTELYKNYILNITGSLTFDGNKEEISDLTKQMIDKDILGLKTYQKIEAILNNKTFINSLKSRENISVEDLKNLINRLYFKLLKDGEIIAMKKPIARTGRKVRDDIYENYYGTREPISRTFKKDYIL